MATVVVGILARSHAVALVADVVMELNVELAVLDVDRVVLFELVAGSAVLVVVVAVVVVFVGVVANVVVVVVLQKKRYPEHPLE